MIIEELDKIPKSVANVLISTNHCNQIINSYYKLSPLQLSIRYCKNKNIKAYVFRTGFGIKSFNCFNYSKLCKFHATLYAKRTQQKMYLLSDQDLFYLRCKYFL